MTIKKNVLIFWFVILSGFVIGTVIGEALKSNADFSILSEGIKVGIYENPFTIDLGMAGLTFGFFFKMTFGGGIGIILALLLYKAISK